MFTKYGAESHDSELCTRYSLASSRINGTKSTRGSDYQTSKYADNHGIEEGTSHIYITLTGRMVSLCSSCCDRSRTKTCFVREYTAGNTPTHCSQHGSDDRTANTTSNSIRCKSHTEDFRNACRQCRCINYDNNNRHYKVEGCHCRNDNTGYSTDGLNTLEKNYDRK